MCFVVADSSNLDIWLDWLDSEEARSVPGIDLGNWFADIELLVPVGTKGPALVVQKSWVAAWSLLAPLTCAPSVLEVVLVPALPASSCLPPVPVRFG